MLRLTGTGRVGDRRVERGLQSFERGIARVRKDDVEVRPMQRRYERKVERAESSHCREANPAVPSQHRFGGAQLETSWSNAAKTDTP
jgi:hypothetical protein